MSRRQRNAERREWANTEPAPASAHDPEPVAPPSVAEPELVVVSSPSRPLSKGLTRVRALESVLADGMPYFAGDTFVCREETGAALIASGRAERAA